MKILYLHIGSTLGSGKANIVSVLSICKTFVDNGIKIDLVLNKPGFEISDLEIYIRENFNFDLNFNIIFSNPKFGIKRFDKYLYNYEINRIIQGNDADFVFLRTPYFIENIIKSGKRVIFESHNNQMHDRYSFVDNYWKRKIVRLSSSNYFALFVSISKNLENYWRKKGIPESKLIAVHGGYLTEKFSIKVEKSKARKKLGIPQNEKIVMYVGSLYPDREIDNILILAKEIPNVTFYIIGGPEKNKKHFEKLVDIMGLLNVKLLGPIPHSQVPSYLYSSDVLLALWSPKVPTMDYCSPLKVFEYMASGQTIVAHNFPTIREILEDNINALLVDPHNIGDLISTVKKIADNNPKFLGKNARDRAIKYHSWNFKVDQIKKRLLI
tara:strand:+ start:4611 stop:5756 length:1146 start_codon:yes stop_codon:yes gene_type:complete